MTKVNPRTVRVKIFLTALDPKHRYSNESERANEDIYDDLKLKKSHLKNYNNIFNYHLLCQYHYFPVFKQVLVFQ